MKVFKFKKYKDGYEDERWGGPWDIHLKFRPSWQAKAWEVLWRTGPLPRRQGFSVCYI